MSKDKRKWQPRNVALALQEATRQYNQFSGAGAGRAGADDDPLSEGLQLADKGGQGEGATKPKANNALHGVTRNLQFAETLAGEQRELDPQSRTFLKQQFGQAVDHIKVYSGRYTDLAVQALGAEAMAIAKQHIFIRSDKYRLGTSEGLGLLAHEVAHTLQGAAGSRGEKEHQARDIQSQASQSAEQGSTPGYAGMDEPDRELAMEQAASTPGDVPREASAAGPGQSLGKKPGSLGEAGKSVEEAQLFDVLKTELFRRLRDEADLQYRIQGMVAPGR